jgi:formamidopyrimidine-DNA glycosylase
MAPEVFPVHTLSTVPELPDVEHLRRRWEEHVPGATITRTVTTDRGILRNTTPRALDAALSGARVEPPERIGKWLLARTDGPTVVLHFGMDGSLRWADGPEGRHRHDRVVFETDRGEMRFRNMRKLGGLWLAHDDSELAGVLGNVGPDALALSRRRVASELRARRGQAKSALMDQTHISGIGNLIADEVLWQARLHPKTRLEELDDAEIDALAGTVGSVLRRAVASHDYVTRNPSWLLRVRGGRDAACPRCGTPLARTVAAGRTTWFCPSCQPETRSGAPRRTRRPGRSR